MNSSSTVKCQNGARDLNCKAEQGACCQFMQNPNDRIKMAKPLECGREAAALSREARFTLLRTQTDLEHCLAERLFPLL